MSEKPNIRGGNNKVKTNTALQSLEDKLRIANKVNLFFSGLLKCWLLETTVADPV